MGSLIRKGSSCIQKKILNTSVGVRSSENTSPDYRTNQKNVKFATSDEHFENILKSTRYHSVVIEFYNKFNDLYVSTFSVVEQSKDYGNVLFLRVDKNQCPKTAFDYEIVSTPEFVFRKKNYEVDRIKYEYKLLTDSFGLFVHRNHTNPVKPVMVTVKSVELYAKNDKEFTEHVTILSRQMTTNDDNKGLTVVLFTSDWCHSHNRMLRFVHEEAYATENVWFLIANVDLCGTAATNYHIGVLPTFVIRKEGVVVDTLKSTDQQQIMKRVRQLKTTCDFSTQQNPVTLVTSDGDFGREMTVVGDQYVLICFCRRTCEVCEQNINRISKEHLNTTFLLVIIESCKTTTKHYKITKTPTFVFRKNSKDVDRFVSTNISLLKQFIEQCKNKSLV